MSTKIRTDKSNVTDPAQYLHERSLCPSCRLLTTQRSTLESRLKASEVRRLGDTVRTALHPAAQFFSLLHPPMHLLFRINSDNPAAAAAAMAAPPRPDATGEAATKYARTPCALVVVDYDNRGTGIRSGQTITRTHATPNANHQHSGSLLANGYGQP
ncbi:hypothetical protein EAI_04089 [Harpegnathos saltator]|uniref:Uncharacterized protein n=1 Tax=Harpegnathos saltator TaxID=610380 RepID=E2C391_HARSA|nr:hypothetical protein EAI_04089 [Harpegnathos saltator]